MFRCGLQHEVTTTRGDNEWCAPPIVSTRAGRPAGLVLCSDKLSRQMTHMWGGQSVGGNVQETLLWQALYVQGARRSFCIALGKRSLGD